MIPGKYNMLIVRGGTFSIGITAKSLGVTTKFSQYTTMRMQIRPPWTYAIDVVRPAPLFELTYENGRLSVGPMGDEVMLNITAADTATLPFTEGQYDIEMVIAATPETELDGVITPATVEVVDKMLYGQVTVMGEVTV